MLSPTTMPADLLRVTVKPSDLSSSSRYLPAAAMPSASPVPVSMLTSCSSVLTTAGFSAVAAANSASSRVWLQAAGATKAAASSAPGGAVNGRMHERDLLM